ncbi:transposase [Candidatus Enterovibrio escicola]
MDNASFHKHSDTLEAIEALGCTLEWLIPYSPSFDLMEHK